MATYTSFAELPIWREAVGFAAEIYRFCEAGKLRSDFRMRDQLRSAATSIASNIAEGFEYHNRKSMIQFLHYSKGSAGEAFTQLTILHEAEMISREDYRYFSEKASALNQKIGGFIKYLKNKSAV